MKATLIRILFSLELAMVVLGVGCQSETQSPQSATIPQVQADESDVRAHLNHAQPKLKTIKLWLGAEELITEIAATTQERATGMMFREKMAENEGMLFVFTGPAQLGFYMKNTKVPLSIAYIDPAGKILEIHDLQPLELAPVESKSSQVQFALETPQGWFKRHNIPVGTLVRTEKGTLQETFFSR